MMSKKVLITDEIHPICSRLLKEAGYEPLIALKQTPDELRNICASADAWIIRSGTTITADLIATAASLQVIGRAGVGVDNVDIKAATRAGILVLNAPAGNTISTAEHSMAMLLSLSRRVPGASASVRAGEWNRKEFTGIELYEKTLGIVGAGKIGREVAVRALAFGMNVIAVDPVMSAEVAADLGISLVPFEEVLTESDFISIHAPLNDATRDLFNADTLARCRQGVMIINCARGGIVNEVDLLEALKAGHVGGAALDVYSVEPPTEQLRELLVHPRVVATPHIAASTDEAQRKVALQVTEQVIHALRGESVSTAVNLSITPAPGMSEYEPYYRLATKLGVFSAQMLRGHAYRIKVGCRGEALRSHAPNLELAVLQGFLSTITSAPVNHVSAPYIARESGLQSGYETHEVTSAFSSQLDVSLETDSDLIEISGTVFGDGEELIVRINGYRLEVRPQGTILLYQNDDRPGMLASVGAILATADINIASLSLGRKNPGEVALTVISVDEPVGPDVLSALSEIPGVYAIRSIQL